MLVDEALVVVEPAHSGKEDLPLQAQSVLDRDHLGHLRKLLTQAAVGKRDR